MIKDFFIPHVGDTISPVTVLAMPHCIVLMDGDQLCGMLINCCDRLVFKIEPVNHVWEVLLSLLGCYYVYDLQYFAAFGLLSVLDKHVAQSEHLNCSPSLSLVNCAKCLQLRSQVWCCVYTYVFLCMMQPTTIMCPSFCIHLIASSVASLYLNLSSLTEISKLRRDNT